MSDYIALAIHKFEHAEIKRDQGNNNDASHFQASMAQAAALIAIAEQLARIADALTVTLPGTGKASVEELEGLKRLYKKAEADK